MALTNKLPQFVRELRIHLCQESKSSDGLRNFVLKEYANLKSANKTLPILVRECNGTLPKIHVRFEFGKERDLSLENLTSAQIKDLLIKTIHEYKPQ